MSTSVQEHTAGELVELARYTISSGQRVIYGQRLNGIVRLTDLPDGGHGRRYLIERELRSMAELEALITDYRGQAARHDSVPCHVLW